MNAFLLLNLFNDCTRKTINGVTLDIIFLSEVMVPSMLAEDGNFKVYRFDFQSSIINRNCNLQWFIIRTGAHTNGFNNVSIGVAFIGRFDDSAPPKRQLNAVQALIKEGLELENLDQNYNLFGHCQLGKSIVMPSPGPALFRIIKTWNHWASHPIGACKF